MGIIDNIFVFADAVNKNTEDETIKLNIDNKVLHFFHNDKEIVIDTEVLESNTSTCVVYNQLTGNDYVLYNFKELCQAMGVKSREFLSLLQQRCFIQIDTNNHRELFIKIFLLKGMNELPSDTNDFSTKSHHTVNDIHPLDMEYSFEISNIYGVKTSDRFILEFNLNKSYFYRDDDVYCNYAGQSYKCKNGKNFIVFKYVVGENIYFGNIRNRSIARCIEVNKLIKDSNYYKDIKL